MYKLEFGEELCGFLLLLFFFLFFLFTKKGYSKTWI